MSIVDDETTVEGQGFVVYWRPGCPFCWLLLRQFRRHGLEPEQRNIWQDPVARQFLNDRIGSETVPTVVVGEQVLVNPSATQVAEALEALR